ncbi:MAG: hypothetical protein AAFZ04_00955 [Pseudomonadota bacterium]
MHAFLLGIAFLATGLIGPLAVLAQAPAPVPGAPVAVIAMNPEAVIDQGGARAIGPLTARFGILAQADDTATIDALYAAGAWRVIDGAWLATLCGVKIL